MNSNLVHNVLNIAIAAIGLVTAFALFAGCTQMASGDLDCTTSTWISPGTALAITGAFGAIKTFINIGRDGFTGLAKKQPPVIDHDADEFRRRL